MGLLVRPAPGICASAADVGYDSALSDINPPPRILMFIARTKTIASEHQLHFMHCNFLYSCMILKYCFLSFRYSLYIYTCTMLFYILFISYLSILDATGE